MKVLVDWIVNVSQVHKNSGEQLLSTKNIPCPAEGLLVSNPTAAALSIALFSDQAPQTADIAGATRIVPVGARTLIALPTAEYIGIQIYATLTTAAGSRSTVLVEALDTISPATGKFSASDLADLADASGTIATASTAQTALAGNIATRYLFVENVAGSSSGTVIWVNFGAAATAGPGSIALGPGQALEYDRIIPNGAVSVLSSTASAPYTVKYA